MKHILRVLTGFLFIIVPALTSAATWQVDPDHSSFQFKVRHLTVSNVKGEFTKAKGTVTMDDQDFTKMKIEITIDAASIDTAHAKRDEHLRSGDFFDVAKYPTLTFISKKVEKGTDGKGKVIGDLTIRGITREVSMEVEGPTSEIKDPGGRFRRGATATGKINRKEFNILWSRTLDQGGLVVADEVFLSVEVELIKVN
jgi:polyisoprenoid-binding protein YceI